MSQLQLKTLGSKSDAWKVFERMLQGSRAYRDRLGSTAPDSTWEALPVLTKKNFYAVHPWRDLVPKESYRDVYSVIRSSGSTNTDGSNRGFFWPQLKSEDSKGALESFRLAKELFRMPERRTLAIVGLSLGSWAGGEQFSFLFKSLALRSEFPLVVFSPGNQHQEILEIIENAPEEFDQILIALCPSAIFYLERLAQQKGVTLPVHKITYVVTGEPFPEEMRLDLKRRSAQTEDQLTILSLYGSADTGIIGFESLPLIQLRQLLSRNPKLADEFGFSSRSVPNLFHVHANEQYLESVGGELLITQWQGLPLVRYNLEDHVSFFSWKEACRLAAEADPSTADRWKAYGQLDLPDFMSVSGRTHGCVFLCGSNIFESMLQEVFLRSRLKDLSTGSFVAWTEVQNGQQVLSWQVELKKGTPIPQGSELEEIHAEFVSLLSEQQPEFAEDYEKFYRPFEKDGLRIFRFHFTEATGLSEHPHYSQSVKRKILIQNGPID